MKNYLVIGSTKNEAEAVKKEMLEYHLLKCGSNSDCLHIRVESIKTIKLADAIKFNSKVKLTEGALLFATEEDLIFIKKLTDSLRNKEINEHLNK